MPSFAFTGHRNMPPQGSGILLPVIENIMKFTDNGLGHWHMGGASGFDTFVYGLRVGNLANHLHIPFTYQHDAIRNLDGYSIYDLNCDNPSCKPIPYNGDMTRFQARNRCMVDNADTVLAYYNGGYGGTRNCIDYALRMHKQVINVITGKQIIALR